MIEFWTWYKNLYLLGDDKTRLAAVSATLAAVTFIFNFILSKVFKNDIIKQMLLAFVFTIFEYWHISLLVIGGISIFNSQIYFFGNFLSVKFISIAIIGLFIFDIIIPTVVFVSRFLKPHSISIYGCFTVKDNKQLIIDIGSEELNKAISDITHSVATKHYTFSNNFVQIAIREIPKFLPIILGFQGLNSRIKKNVASKKHLSSLHFIKNKEENRITAILNFDEDQLTNTEPVKNAEGFINRLTQTGNLNNLQTVEVGTKIYFLLFGIIHIDSLLDEKQYSIVHYILDSNDKLIHEIRNDLSKAEPKDDIQKFLDFWQSNTDRYRSITFLEQKEYTASIKYIFQAISLNPYYPYASYEDLKPDYTKKYGIKMADELNHTETILETNDMDPEHNDRVKMELLQQIKFPDSTWHYEIVHEIMRRDMSDQNINLIEAEMAKLDSTDPFILISKSEILKYLRKGTEKINEVYVDRVDECMKTLREAFKLDSSFVLIHSKLGAILFMKGIHFENDSFITESGQIMNDSFHFLTQLGFKIRK